MRLEENIPDAFSDPKFSDPKFSDLKFSDPKQSSGALPPLLPAGLPSDRRPRASENEQRQRGS